MSAQRSPAPGGNRRSYIATQNFSGYFYSYVNNALEPVTDDDMLCPAGRVLRESGRKLYPKANPGIKQYYVGVYDPVTYLNGFIDPNGGIFAEFNTNKPHYLEDNYSDDGESDDNTEGPDLGDPVYTKGTITAISHNPNGTNNDNYIQLFNDISGGNSAYFGMDGPREPYVGLECEEGSYVYMGAYPRNTYIQMNSSDEAQIEMNTSGGYIGLYASDGSVYNSGVLHPYNTCGNVSLGEGGVANVTIPTVSDPIVMINRKTIVNEVGILTWSINGTTLTIYSNDSRDRGEISWLLLSSSN